MCHGFKVQDLVQGNLDMWQGIRGEPGVESSSLGSVEDFLTTATVPHKHNSGLSMPNPSQSALFVLCTIVLQHF